MSPAERARNIQTQLNSMIECPPNMEAAIEAEICAAVEDSFGNFATLYRQAKAEGRQEGQARLKELLDEKARLCYEDAARIVESVHQGECPESMMIRARIGEK